MLTYPGPELNPADSLDSVREVHGRLENPGKHIESSGSGIRISSMLLETLPVGRVHIAQYLADTKTRSLTA